MAISMNDTLVLAAQMSIEGKMFKVVGNKHVPYSNSADVLATITATRRHIGQVFRVANGAAIEDWEFVGGIADENLVKKGSLPAGGATGQVLTKASGTDGDAGWQTPSGGGSISDDLQTYTSGSTVTVTDGKNILIINPSTLQSAIAITLPATPSARNDIDIYFGGTIAAGSTVVTTVSILANTGQTLFEALVPTTMSSGEYLSYKWIPSLNRWYAKR
jgi:hypothetical protein